MRRLLAASLVTWLALGGEGGVQAAVATQRPGEAVGRQRVGGLGAAVAEGRSLAELARALGLVLMVGHNHRYLGGVRWIRERVAERHSVESWADRLLETVR